MQIETRISSMRASAGKFPAAAATSQQLWLLQTMTYTSESSTRSELYKRCRSGRRVSVSSHESSSTHMNQPFDRPSKHCLENNAFNMSVCARALAYTSVSLASQCSLAVWVQRHGKGGATPERNHFVHGVSGPLALRPPPSPQNLNPKPYPPP